MLSLFFLIFVGIVAVGSSKTLELGRVKDRLAMMHAQELRQNGGDTRHAELLSDYNYQQEKMVSIMIVLAGVVALGFLAFGLAPLI